VQDLPSVGITGALVLVIAYLLASNFRDRLQHEKALAAREGDHASELSMVRVAYEADLAGLRLRLAALEKRLAELEAELDTERERRRAAEDAAARARRQRLPRTGASDADDRNPRPG
jgi:chromosome segregation ATPase